MSQNKNWKPTVDFFEAEKYRVKCSYIFGLIFNEKILSGIGRGPIRDPKEKESHDKIFLQEIRNPQFSLFCELDGK
jgi:hypothetical protein